MRHFWTMVDEYLKAPMSEPNNTLVRIAPAPERCPLVDRLIAALLPLPGAADGAVNDETASACARSCSGAATDAVGRCVGASDAHTTARQTAPHTSGATGGAAGCSEADGRAALTALESAGRARESAGDGSRAAASSPPTCVCSRVQGSGGMSAARPDRSGGAGEALNEPEVAEGRLRQQLRQLGLLREHEAAAECRSDPVGAEMHRELRKLHSLACSNAASRLRSRQGFQARAARDARRRIAVAAAAHVQQRYAKAKRELARMKAAKGRGRN